jgi:hypothetical protein
VYVDDATGKLMELRFVKSESTFDYFASTVTYLGRHGKPVAFYSYFKRVTYLVEPGPDTSPLGGKRVRVYEWEDGRVEIHAEGRALPYSIFDQNPNVTQGAIVENKRLGAALAVIQAAQSERDRIRLDSKKLTIRQKDRIRAAREAVQPSVPVVKESDHLGAVAAYFQQFEKEQEDRRKAQNLKAAQRRKERACAQQNRTSLLGREADIPT